MKKAHSSDSDFNTKLLSIILYLFGTDVRNVTQPATIPGIAARLGISGANLTLLWNLFYDWTDFYPKSQNPATTGHVVINKKNETRIAFEALWSIVVGDMIKSALIEDDRVSLYLPKRDEVRTETETKDNAPGAQVEPSIHGEHVIRFINPDDPHTQSMPKGQKIYLEKYVGEPNLSEDKIPFNSSDIVTTFLYNVKHDPASTGKTAYYRPSYITTTGKKGKTGVVVSAVIM